MISKLLSKLDSPQKLAAFILSIVFLLIVGWYFRNAIGNKIEQIKEWRFSKQVAEKDAVIQHKEQENQQLREDLIKLKALGDSKQIQIDSLNAELTRYGEQAQKAVALQKEAAEQYEQDKNNIAIDVSLYQRCQDYCTERKEVGYPCRASYCDRYSH